MKRKIVLYTFLYLIISIASAFGAITLSSNLQKSASGQSDTPPYELTQIVNHIFASSALAVDFEIDIIGENSSSSLLLSAQTNIPAQNEDLNFTGQIVYKNGEDESYLNIDYVNHAVYADIQNNKIFFETYAVEDPLLDIFMSLLGYVGLDLSTLNINDILLMLKNFNQTNIGDDILLSIEVPLIGSLNLTTDSDYKLKSLSIPEFKINDQTTISVHGNIDYPQDIVIDGDFNGYNDITNIMNVATDLITRDFLSFDFVASFKGQEIIGQLDFEPSSLDTNITINTNSGDISLLFLRDTLYLEIGQLYLKFNINDLDELSSILARVMDIELPSELIITIIQSIQNKDFETLFAMLPLADFDIANLDLSSLDLSFLNAIETSGNVTMIPIDSIGNIYITADNSKFSEFKLETEIFDINLKSTEVREIALAQSQESYADISDFFSTIENVFNIVYSPCISGEMELLFNGIVVPVSFDLSINDGINGYLYATVFGQELELIINSGTAYVQFSNISVKADLKEFLQSDNLLSSIMSILDIVQSLPSIDVIQVSQEGFILKMGEMSIECVNGENCISINFENDLVSLKGDIFAGHDVVSPPQINDQEYANLADYLPVFNNIYSYLTEGKFYFDIQASIDSFVVDGFIDFDHDGLQAELCFDNGKTFGMVLIYQNKLYLNINEIYLSFDFDELDELVQIVNQYFGIDLSSILNFNDILADFDLSDLDMSLAGNCLTIEFNQAVIDIIFDENIKQIDINYDLISAKMNVAEQNHQLSTINKEDYQDISKVADLIGKAYSSIINSKIALDITLQGSVQLSATVEMDIASDKFTAIIVYNDMTAKLYIEDEMLFIELETLYLKASLSEINSLCEILTSISPIDIPLDKILEIYNLFKSGNLTKIFEMLDFDLSALTNLDLSILKELVIDENSLTLTVSGLGKIQLALSNNTLSSFSLENENISLLANSKPYQNLSHGNEGVYISISPILPTVEKLVSILSNQTLTGSGSITVDDLQVDFDYIIDYSNELLLSANIYAFGQNVNMKYYNNNFYFEALGNKLYFSSSQVDQVISFLSDTFDINLNIDYLLDLLKDLLKTEFNKNFIKNIVQLENGFEIQTLKNLSLTVLATDNNASVSIDSNEFELYLNLKPSSINLNTPNIDQNSYLNIVEFLPHITYLYQAIQTQKMGISFDGSILDFSFNGNIYYSNGLLSLNANVYYNDLTAQIILYNNSIYLSLYNIKVMFSLNEIDRLSDFVKEYIQLDISSLIDGLSSFDLNNIESILKDLNIKIERECIVLSYQNFTVNLAINQVGSYIASVSGGDLQMNLEFIESTSNVRPAGSYYKLTNAINLFEMLFEFLNKKQFGVNLNLKLNNDSIYGDFQFDLVNQFKMSGSLYSYTLNNMNLSVSSLNNWTYFDVNGLYLKMNNSSLKEIAFMLVNALGLDVSSLNWFDDITTTLNFDGIQNLLGQLEEFTIESILAIIPKVKSFTLNAYGFNLVIDGAGLYGNSQAQDLTISLSSNGLRITSISIKNLYSNSDLSEKIDLTLSLQYFYAIQTPDLTKNYYDISGLKEILKAVVNMANYRDFTLSGSMKIVGSLIGIDISDEVNYNLKVKVVNGKIELYGVIGSIPVIPGVNNDVPYKVGDTNGGNNRYLYIYYKDGYVYLHRSEFVNIMFGISTRSYEKMTKVPLTHLMQNLSYYIQYALGLKDNIMSEINKSLNSDPGFINFSNILKSYSQSGMSYNFSLNMKELTGSQSLDNLNLSLTLAKDSTGNNYLKDISYSLFMPLADIFSLTISSNNTSFVNFGDSVNMSNLYNFINNYRYGDFEQWEASNGKWSKVA